MTEWTAFNLVFQNLVTYYTGSYAVLALGFCLVFLLFLVAAGLDFRYSIVFSIPVMAGFVALGWLGGEFSWTYNLLLIGVALIYGYAVLKITGG